MVIVKMSGGLGNQMFQHAMCLAMRKRGYEVKIDISKFEYCPIHNNYELEEVFGIQNPVASIKEVKKLGYRWDNRITRKLMNSPLKKKTICFDKNMGYSPKVFESDNRYLAGYWQNEKYFLDIKDQVYEAFRFPALEGEMKKIGDMITSTKSVGIHIRRGNYLNHPLYQGICELDYYKRAIQMIMDQVGKDITLFFFSNDNDWVKENFNYPDMHVVEGNTGLKSYRDMQLLSMCKHIVIANSTFSWWSAWLNQNPDKIVIAPKKWLNDPKKGAEDIVPASWTRI